MTIPILVYLLGEDVGTAATTSLLVVGLTAATGAVAHWRAGTVRVATALALSAVASGGSVAGSFLRARVGGREFLLAFAGVLVIAAVLIWRPPGARVAAARECVLRPDLRSCAKLGAAGVVVGFLTGFFGVGGGFAIVAVLLVVLSFPTREAIGTSLVVVALASPGRTRDAATRAEVNSGEVPLLLLELPLVDLAARVSPLQDLERRLARWARRPRGRAPRRPRRPDV